MELDKTNYANHGTKSLLLTHSRESSQERFGHSKLHHLVQPILATSSGIAIVSISIWLAGGTVFFFLKQQIVVENQYQQ